MNPPLLFCTGTITKCGHRYIIIKIMMMATSQPKLSKNQQQPRECNSSLSLSLNIFWLFSELIDIFGNCSLLEIMTISRRQNSQKISLFFDRLILEFRANCQLGSVKSRVNYTIRHYKKILKKRPKSLLTF